MRPECERYEALVAAAEAGSARTAEDAAFVAAHLAACGECAALERGLGLLALTDEEPAHFPLDELATRRLVNAVLAEADAVEERQERRGFRVVLSLVAALVALVAGGLAVRAWRGTAPGAGAPVAPMAVVTPAPEVPPTPVVEPPKPVEVGREVEAQLRLALGEKGAPLGRGLAVGATATAKGVRGYAVGPYVWLRVVEGEVTLAALKEKQVRVALARGRVDVQVAPGQGVALEVVTEDATVAVVGTRFSVARRAGGSRVVVAHGQVDVRTALGVQPLGAGQGYDVGGSVGAATPGELSALAELAAQQQLSGAGAGRLAWARGQAASIDGVSFDRGPIELLLPPGRHRVEVRGAGKAKKVETVTAREPARAGGGAASTPSGGAGEAWLPPLPTNAEPLGPGAAELMEQAQQARGRKAWREAERAYRAIIEGWPSSSVAGAALVSLGQLEVDHLAAPRAGLARCEAYVAQYPSGPLRSEAELCRIRAFRALGDAASERAAIDGFLLQFPDDFSVAKLKARRDALAP